MKGGSLFSSRHSPSSTPTRAAAADHHNTFSDTMMDENLNNAESIITKWALDHHSQDDKFHPIFAAHDRQEAKSFLEAVTGLQSAMRYFVKLGSSSSSKKLVRSQNLMQLAIKRLEKEFYLILSANRKNLDCESISTRSSKVSSSTRSSISDYYEDEALDDEDHKTPTRTPPGTPPLRGGDLISEADAAVADLRSIAECMIASGYAKECVNIYGVIRKSIIDETLYYLGVEKLTHSQMQKMEWRILEPKIKTWLHAARVAIKTLFHGERILCDIVFSSSDIIAESCFTEISKDAAVSLFGFPENFAKSRKIQSPEKIFRALDLYETISDMWPEVESIFSHESLSPVRSEAAAALEKLGEAVRAMLGQFEAAVQKDSSKTPAGGGVHPLTRYVMNFLVFLGDYSGELSEILGDWQVTAQTPLPESYFSSPISGAGEDPAAAAITVRLAWLILVLLCKLDGKAVLYDDVALSYLFLANNLNYVVSKVRNSSLGLLMGPDWIWTNQAKVNRYLANYERMGWSRAASTLPEDPTADIEPEEVIEYFQRFYSGFEEAYKKQCSWVIPDPKLRDEVKVSIAKMIVPSYFAFYEKHRGTNLRGAGGEPVIRYAPEDLGNYLSDLFFVVGGSSTTTMTTSLAASLQSSLLSRGH